MFVIKRGFSSFLQLNERTKLVQNACKAFAEQELRPVASQSDKLAQ